MKNYVRFGLLIVATLAWASSASAQPFVIAGWDTWDDPTAPTATVTASDITASATASAVGGTANWTIMDSGSDPGRGSSIDTTWGTFDGNGNAASAVTDVGPANMTATTGKTDAEVTFTITNNGTADLSMDAFHMDVFAFRFKAPRIYSLDVLDGSDITVGTVFASEGAPTNGNDTNDIFTNNGTEGLDTHDLHMDLDIDMTGLADNVLANGESATIQINFTGGAGEGGGHHLFLDNVAFSSGFVFDTPGILGDFDGDGDVDLADLDQYNQNLGQPATGELAALDLNGDGTVGADDFQQHYSTLVETSNGGKGTALGDVNLDGVVNVLGDAFALVGNLNNPATSWSQGDLNADGAVNVLGDAFGLVGNLGANNGGGGAAPSAAAVPEPGTLSLLLLSTLGVAVRRRK
jgi:hypothetical protein